MPLAGGDADKAGNRYEGLWTANVLLRLLNNEIRSVYLEPVGTLGDGIEFLITQLDETKLHYQIKRQHSGTGAWTLSKLQSEGVIDTIRTKLFGDTAAWFAFSSVSDAPEMRDLSEESRKAHDVNQFVQEYLGASTAREQQFKKLCDLWQNCTQAEAFNTLRRIRIDASGEQFLRKETEYRASTLTEGNPGAVVDILAQFALDSVHHELSAVAVWNHLQQRGITRRERLNDSNTLAQIVAQNKRFTSSHQNSYILHEELPREETSTILNLLQEEQPSKRFILVSGNAGIGKSGVLDAVLDRVSSWNWPVLAIQLDQLDNETTAKQAGIKFDLPDSPATILAQYAGNKPCLLLIDQLDYVSQSSGRNPRVFDIATEIIEQCKIHPQMRILMACRQFDLQNDYRLRDLVGEKGIAKEVAVNALSRDTVVSVIVKCRIDPATLSEMQYALLAVPLHLKIFSEVVSGKSDEDAAFSTVQDLYDRYWQRKQQDLRQRLGRDSQWIEIIDTLLERMTQGQTLSAPQTLLDSFGEAEVGVFRSEGVLISDGKRVSFFHETFFDYCFARRFIARGKKLLSFLRESQDQPLFFRAVVRQILSYERGEDFDQYLSDLRELLTASDVRFHIKRLVLRLLNALPNPTEAEAQILIDLTKTPEHDPTYDSDLCDQAWQALFSAPWFHILDKIGFISGEMACDSQSRINRIVHYLSYMARNDASERVAEIALSMVERAEP